MRLSLLLDVRLCCGRCSTLPWVFWVAKDEVDLAFARCELLAVLVSCPVIRGGWVAGVVRRGCRCGPANTGLKKPRISNPDLVLSILCGSSSF